MTRHDRLRTIEFHACLIQSLLKVINLYLNDSITHLVDDVEDSLALPGWHAVQHLPVPITDKAYMTIYRPR